MRIILDKNTLTERIYSIDSFEERVIDNRLSGSKQIAFSPEPPEFDLGNKKFNTIEITKDVNGETVNVPIYGTYNIITSLQTSTSDDTSYLFMNIIFGYQANE